MPTSTQGAISYQVTDADGGVVTPRQNIAIQSGAWHPLHFEETFDATAGALDVVYDGATICDLTNIPTWSTGTLPTTHVLGIGAAASHQTGACDVCFDNIVVH